MPHLTEWFRPSQVAAAFWINGTTLRAWNTQGPGLKPALVFGGEFSEGGHRRYRMADAVLVALVADLTGASRGGTGFQMATPAAIAVANAVATFNETISEQFWSLGEDALVQMEQAYPVAIVTPHNDRWEVQAFPTAADYQRASKDISPASLTVQMYPLWQGTYMALTRPTLHLHGAYREGTSE